MVCAFCVMFLKNPFSYLSCTLFWWMFCFISLMNVCGSLRTAAGTRLLRSALRGNWGRFTVKEPSWPSWEARECTNPGAWNHQAPASASLAGTRSCWREAGNWDLSTPPAGNHLWVISERLAQRAEPLVSDTCPAERRPKGLLRCTTSAL